MTVASPSVVVRPLSLHDLGDYRAIRLAALATAPHAFGSVHAVEAVRPPGDHAARLGGARVFGAYDAARIVGMVGLRRETGAKDAHKASLWGFFVEPGDRRRGIGTALLTAALAAAQAMVEQVLLAVVADQLAALALYQRFGFVSYGVEPRALKTGALYADKVLMIRVFDTDG